MEDTPFAVDASSSGKRKRSPVNLVDVSIPIFPPPDFIHGGLEESHVSPPDTYPLPKRPRLPPKPPVITSSLESLPPAVLQHIFSYVDPLSLSCLICVNRHFRNLLDSRYELPQHSNGAGHSLALHPRESIWSVSRRRFVANMPRPMSTMSEQAQFLLAFGSKCQFCGIRSSRVESTNTWYESSLSNPVRIIWPFKVRSCTDCIRSRVRKVNQSYSHSTVVF